MAQRPRIVDPVAKIQNTLHGAGGGHSATCICRLYDNSLQAGSEPWIHGEKVHGDSTEVNGSWDEFEAKEKPFLQGLQHWTIPHDTGSELSPKAASTREPTTASIGEKSAQHDQDRPSGQPPEVDRMYAKVVIVEAKCIDIDKRQLAAAQEKDPLKRVHLGGDQWQSLIAHHQQRSLIIVGAGLHVSATVCETVLRKDTSSILPEGDDGLDCEGSLASIIKSSLTNSIQESSQTAASGSNPTGSTLVRETKKAFAVSRKKWTCSGINCFHCSKQATKAVKTLLRSNIDPHRLGIQRADAKTVTCCFLPNSISQVINGCNESFLYKLWYFRRHVNTDAQTWIEQVGWLTWTCQPRGWEVYVLSGSV